MSQINVLNLLHPKEKTYRTVVIVISTLVWGIIAFGLFSVISRAEYIAGPVLFALAFYVGFFVFIFWIIGLYYKAIIYGESVKVGPHQYLKVYQMAQSHSDRLGLEKMPDVFIHSGSGMINAFAIAFLSRRYVVLNAPIVDLMLKRGQDAELSFIIGHELAHHAAGHTNVWRGIFIRPAMFIPLLGAAFSRSQELSADRISTALIGNVTTCQQSLIAIAMGSESLANDTNIESFIEQELEIPGFMGFIHKIFSSHPRMTRRVIELKLFGRDSQFKEYENVTMADSRGAMVDSLTNQTNTQSETHSTQTILIVLAILVFGVLGYFVTRSMNNSNSNSDNIDSTLPILENDEGATQESEYENIKEAPAASATSEFAIQPLLNTSFVSESEGTWEQIKFISNENDGIFIEYSDDIDGRSEPRMLRFDASTNELFFTSTPNVRYPISNISSSGFDLLNPNGRSQRFEVMSTK